MLKNIFLINERIYKIKIINKGKRSIINIKARLHLMNIKVAPGGVIVQAKEIPLKRTDPMEIAGFDYKDVQASYAFRFRTYEDLDNIWNEDINLYLRFTIFAMDSLSGFGKVFKQDYHKKRNTIIDGDFEFGDSTEIK